MVEILQCLIRIEPSFFLQNHQSSTVLFQFNVINPGVLSTEKIIGYRRSMSGIPRFVLQGTGHIGGIEFYIQNSTYRLLPHW